MFKENEDYSIYEHNCKTCLYGYEKVDKNCLKCDLTRPFYYYNGEKNNDSCLYPENGCPEELPYYISGKEECYDACPNGYSPVNSSSFECKENKYTYDSNGNKVYLNNDDCVSPYEYQLYKGSECLSQCDLNNNIPLLDSKICIPVSQCINIFKRIENTCDCNQGILTINSETDIKCITVEDVINDLQKKVSKLTVRSENKKKKDFEPIYSVLMDEKEGHYFTKRVFAFILMTILYLRLKDFEEGY